MVCLIFVMIIMILSSMFVQGTWDCLQRNIIITLLFQPRIMLALAWHDLYFKIEGPTYSQILSNWCKATKLHRFSKCFMKVAHRYTNSSPIKLNVFIVFLIKKIRRKLNLQAHFFPLPIWIYFYNKIQFLIIK